MAAEIHGGISKVPEPFKGDLANTYSELFRNLDCPVRTVRVDKDNIIGPEDAFKGRFDLMFLVVTQNIDRKRGATGIRRKVFGHEKSLL
jgi:hypothetical protein